MKKMYLAQIICEHEKMYLAQILIHKIVSEALSS